MNIFVEITTKSGGRMVVPHGDGATMPSGAYGGFQAVPRPKNKPITEYAGRDLETYPIPLRFNKLLQPDQNINNNIAKLESWAISDKYDEEPEIVQVSGSMLVRPKSRLWVIADLQWDMSTTQKDSNGQFLNQDVTMVLLEMNKDSTLSDIATALEAYKNSKKKKSYKVKKGDSLTKIATNELKDRKLWKKLRDLNKKKGNASVANKGLKVGEHLRLPS